MIAACVELKESLLGGIFNTGSQVDKNTGNTEWIERPIARYDYHLVICHPAIPVYDPDFLPNFQAGKGCAGQVIMCKQTSDPIIAGEGKLCYSICRIRNIAIIARALLDNPEREMSGGIHPAHNTANPIRYG